MLWSGLTLVLAAVAGLLAHWIVFTLALRAARRAGIEPASTAIARLRRPLRLLFPLLAMQIAYPAAAFDDSRFLVLRQVLTLAIVGAVIWLITVILSLIEHYIKHRHRVDVADNLEARRVHTQITVLTRTAMVFVIVVGVAAGLMTLPTVRELGAGLLASAGLAGLVVGLAARPVLENVIAGIQLAFTQPIRLDDVVIIDGEWGRIEQITVTYVVVRIWDERRLIVPVSKFISEPFQNWTRQTSQILGTVFLHVDYTTPVDAVREELKKIVQASPKWDGRVCVLQVTDAKEETMELRALVSARDSGAAWDLRVEVREKLIAFLRREYPQCLPRTRVAMQEASQAAG